MKLIMTRVKLLPLFEKVSKHIFNCR